MNKTKPKSLPAQNKIPDWVLYAVPFLCITCWLVITVCRGGLQVRGYYMIHYLYTYDHGFVARGFVGEVLSRLFPSINDTVLRCTNITFAFLLTAGASLCIGKVLTDTKEDKTVFLTAAIMILLICISPPAFRTYFSDAKLDKLLWALALFAVFASGNRFTIWLVPLLCAAATLANPVFAFCSMILIAIVLLHRLYQNGFKIKGFIICGVTYVSILCICIYGYVSLRNLGFSSPEELIDYYFSRYTGTMPIPYQHFYSEWLIDYFGSSSNVLAQGFEIYFQEWDNGIFFIFDTILIALPCYALLTVFWIKTIRAEHERFQKFILFLCAVSPVVILIPNLFSWEGSKYYGNNIMVQLCLILYFLAVKTPSISKTVTGTLHFMKQHLLCTFSLLLYLSFIIFV